MLVGEIHFKVGGFFRRSATIKYLWARGCFPQVISTLTVRQQAQVVLLHSLPDPVCKLQPLLCLRLCFQICLMVLTHIFVGCCSPGLDDCICMISLELLVPTKTHSYICLLCHTFFFSFFFYLSFLRRTNQKRNGGG